MAAGAAFRYFIGGFSPSYASQTIHPETVNKHLVELSTEINTYDHCKTARTTRLGHQAGLVWSVRRHPGGHDDGIQHRVHHGGSFVRVGGLVYGASDGVHESLSREAHSRRDRAVGSQGQFVSVYLVWW